MTPIKRGTARRLGLRKPRVANVPIKLDLSQIAPAFAEMARHMRANLAAWRGAHASREEAAP